MDESIVSDNWLLELSLAEGADPNIRGSRGETPMHVAARLEEQGVPDMNAPATLAALKIREA